ncbi:hypothetical protein MNBD_NITROSPINAE01-120 [hydrothermal vent metagenome]|uniref:Outer membrane protein assembly factor BamE domain-containing protein n=1 Tax=hydrothermal vent metagenome TaxID=652676 RepID=A0A3B1BQU3_9ZZZZ
MKKTIIVLALLSLFSAGCVSTGKNFSADATKNIKKNSTTRSQIHGWFGYPYMTGIDNGDTTWIYNYSKSSVAGKVMVKDLYIVFDENGVVKNFTFSTSFPDEMKLTK